MLDSEMIESLWHSVDDSSASYKAQPHLNSRVVVTSSALSGNLTYHYYC